MLKKIEVSISNQELGTKKHIENVRKIFNNVLDKHKMILSFLWNGEGVTYVYYEEVKDDGMV